MATKQVAISLSDFIFDEMNELAKQLEMPRSRLFALAAEEFLQKYKREDLTRKINAPLSNESDKEENKRLTATKHKYSQLIEGRARKAQAAEAMDAVRQKLSKKTSTAQISSWIREDRDR